MVLFFWMSMYTYQPQLSVYSGMLGAGAAMTGTILSSYGFTQMLLRIPLGFASDRLRRRKLFVIAGAVVTVLSAFGMYLARTPLQLLLFRGLSGVAASAWVTYTVLFSSYFDEKDAPRAMSRLMVFNNMGTVLAMLIGGLASQYFGVRASFLLACVSGGIAVVLSLQVTENVPETAQSAGVRDILGVVSDRNLLLVSFLALLGQIVQQGATLGFTPKFAAELGATPSQLGVLSGAAIFGAMCSSWCNTRYFLARFGSRRCILAGQLLYAASTVLLPIVSRNVYMVVAMQFLVGLGNGAYFPLMMGTAIAGIRGERRGLAMGMFQSIYALGMFIGPLVTGVLIERLPIGTSICCVGLIGFFAWGLALWKLRRKKAAA